MFYPVNLFTVLSYVLISFIPLFFGGLMACCSTLFSLFNVSTYLIFNCLKWLYLALF